MKKHFILLICLLVAACASPEPETSSAELAHSDIEIATPVKIEHTYALVVKDIKNLYMIRMFEGFENACNTFGVKAIFSGGVDDTTAEGQIKALENLIEEKVDAIAIAANEKDKLSAVLTRATEAGIQIVSLDSEVDVDNRKLHVQQASPEMIGRVLMQAAHEMTSGSGKIAILTTTETAPNQSQWVAWMLQEIKENPDVYQDMPIVEILYGLDLYKESFDLTVQLLETHPDIKIIIAPTSMGLQAVADAIDSLASTAQVTGLGLPSIMGKYVRNGICPWFYLWNPVDVGFVAAYALDRLVAGEITGAVGEELSAGSFGILLVTQAQDGGSEIVVGKPYMFDKTNVAIWENIF